MTSIEYSNEECGTVTIEIPPRYSFLRIVRQAVSAVCLHAGVSEFRTAELEMAIDEVCSRIVEHRTMRRDQKTPISISLLNETDRVTIRFNAVPIEVDFSKESSIDQTKLQHEDERKGLGTYVIRRFVDALDVDQDGDSAFYKLSLIKLL